MLNRCNHCNKTYGSADRLHDHDRFTHNLYCTTQLKDGSVIHIERIGGHTGTLYCPNPACQKEFNHSSAIRNHLHKTECKNWKPGQEYRETDSSVTKTKSSHITSTSTGKIKSARRSATTVASTSIPTTKATVARTKIPDHHNHHHPELPHTSTPPLSPVTINVEETVLECSLDDINDDEFWTGEEDDTVMLEPAVPTVDLDEVPDYVLDHERVKAKARVISVSKFKMTTQGAYLNAQLARPARSTLRPFQISVVLDTNVVERHLEQTLTILIKQAQDPGKKPLLMQNLAKFRDTLQGSQEVECTFDGVRESKPLVKGLELNV